MNSDWFITVEIPKSAGADVYDKIVEAVSDAADNAQPEDRTWDIFVYGTGPSLVERMSNEV